MRSLLSLATGLAALPFVAAPIVAVPAIARGDNLLITEQFRPAGGRVGEYTTSGATVNATLISGPFNPFGFLNPTYMAVSGSSLFVVDSFSGGTVGEYTTSGATVNASLLSGLNGPIGIAVSGSNLFVSSGSGIGEYTTAGAT